MAIINFNLNNSTVTQTNKSADQKTLSSSSAPQPGSHGHEDTVAFTKVSTQLKYLEDQINQLPVADPSRIQQVRSNLQNGIYQISDQQTAAKFVQYESQLLTASQGN